MAVPERKILLLITSLTKLTSQGKLSWDAVKVPDSIIAGTGDVVPLYFETKYKHQRLSIYERRHRVYSGEYDEYSWSSEIVFAFIDPFNRNTWEYTGDGSSALLNLFEVVRRSVAKVDVVLDELLKPDDKDTPA